MSSNYQVRGIQETTRFESDGSKILILPFIAMLTGSGISECNSGIDKVTSNTGNTNSYTVDSTIPSSGDFHYIVEENESLDNRTEDVTALLTSFYSDLSKKQTSLPQEAQKLIEADLWDLYIKS